jgi:hypothetical protein
MKRVEWLRGAEPAALVLIMICATPALSMEPAWPLKDRSFQGLTAILRLASPEYCSASIIDRHWLLTARHCVNALCGKADFGSAAIRVGSEDAGATTFDIMDVLCPPTKEEKGVEWPNDLALIRIRWAFGDEASRPALATPSDGALFAVGWSDGTEHPRPAAHMIELVPLARSRCEQLLKDPKICPEGLRLGETQFCAWSGGDPGSTFYGLQKGDSGGPLVKQTEGRRPEIVGVASAACSNSGLAIFEEVSRHRDWIVRETCGFYRYWGDEEPQCRKRLLGRK